MRTWYQKYTNTAPIIGPGRTDTQEGNCRWSNGPHALCHGGRKNNFSGESHWHGLFDLFLPLHAHSSPSSVHHSSTTFLLPLEFLSLCKSSHVGSSEGSAPDLLMLVMDSDQLILSPTTASIIIYMPNTTQLHLHPYAILYPLSTYIQ